MASNPSLLLLPHLSSLAHSLQDRFPVLVHLEFGDHDLAWVNANGNRLAVGLLFGDPFNMDDVFKTVDGCDFAFTAFVRASGHDDFVVFADGY